MEKDTTIGKEKIAGLFDAGTFVEIGAYLKREGGDLTGVVCGYGAVNGKLAYAFAQDSDRQKGAFDALQAKKIETVYEMALKNGAPVIGVFDSIGAYVSDGAGALSAYGKLLACVSRASGTVPQIAVIGGVCSGMAATAAAMFDAVITVKEVSKLFVNAPFLVGREVGTAEYAAENGLAAVSAASEDEAFAIARELISMLPSNCEEGTYADDPMDDVNRLVAVDGLTGRALCEAVADCGRFLEMGECYAKETVTGLAKVGGVCCGFVAGNGSVNGGVLTGDGAKKAARLISFCDSFSIPVVTLIDSEGVAVSAEEEGSPLAAQLGKLAMAYATADTAKVTVVTGKAWGAAFTLMGSRGLGADLVYALPTASVSVMAPESAVAFLWNDRITEENTRAALVEEWNATCAAPEAAAADGSIDDVISSAELRSRICSAVYMLLVKSGNATARKHCNLPL
ncbi:MAG: acetyl-CoA carboxylase [Ruminococcaceae bacterium]|nr:acetyl-CoA carboxylase [Oscillospiraceae bacterium]